MLKIKEILFIFIYVVLALVGTTLIKMGAQDEGKFLLEIAGIEISQKMIFGIIFYGFSFLVYTFVLAKMQISLAIPIASAINSVAIVTIGVIIFNEKLNIGQIFGIGFVLLGVLIIGIFSR